MKQAAIKAAAVVGDRGEWRGRGRRGGAELGRDSVDLVAMAHPYLGARAFRPQAGEERAVVDDVYRRAAEFLAVARPNPAAELEAHGLHAVADREHRHAQGEDDAGRAGGGGLRHRGRAA
jgi:hypothetical protein